MESTSLIDGLSVSSFPRFQDERGSFVKTFHREHIKQLGLNFQCKESFISTSNKGVVRGMHFQTPPKEHWKIVTCLSGSVFDVIVDLRTTSRTYKHVWSRTLDACKNEIILIPPGCAHGFASLEDNSAMVYHTSTEHSPEHDLGVLWSSVPVDWPWSSPCVSQRDQAHPSIDQYKSPFT